MLLKHIQSCLIACTLASFIVRCNSSLVNCKQEFEALDFDILDYRRYPAYFRANSSAIIPQAGQYNGSKAIGKFIRFTTDSNPYFSESRLIHSDFSLKDLDEGAGICTFVYRRVTFYKTNPSLTREATVLSGVILKIEFDYQNGYITVIHAGFKQAFFELFFGTFLSTEKTRRYICDISDQCPNTNMDIRHPECMSRLEALPTFTLTNGTTTFDGNDFGCRALHATFAEENKDYCAQLSFEPKADPRQEMKCQTSKGWTNEDFFDQDDLDALDDLVENKRYFIESSDGYKILSMPKEQTDSVFYLSFGLIAPMVLMVATFLLIKCSEVRESEGDKPPTASYSYLGGGKERRLVMLVLVVLSSLIFGNGVAFAVVELFAGRFGWDEYSWPENDLGDRFRGDEREVMGGTVPQSLLSDNDYRVYAGFVVWITCILSGLGLEGFVRYDCHHHEWSESKERAWRFAQFLYPLLALTSAGLAMQGSYLCLPTCVLGCWKLGFPEVTMFVYAGLYSCDNKLRRCSDFLEGIGLLLHHGAAMLTIAMMVSGVFPHVPAIRHASNVILILVAQHWLVLLKYAHKPLYIAIQLGLEWYFEWSILSDMAEYYYLHWTAAMAAMVMLFAHWLFLITGLVSLFDPVKHRENVIVRTAVLWTANVQSTTRDEGSVSGESELYDDDEAESAKGNKRWNSNSTVLPVNGMSAESEPLSDC
ncbi:MAG: hypothetical protein SGBAC_002290 [Bacillariaceae sp.]